MGAKTLVACRRLACSISLRPKTEAGVRKALLALGSVPKEREPGQLSPEEKCQVDNIFPASLSPTGQMLVEARSEIIHLLHWLCPRILLQTCPSQHAQPSSSQPMWAGRQRTIPPTAHSSRNASYHTKTRQWEFTLLPGRQRMGPTQSPPIVVKLSHNREHVWSTELW